MLTLALTVHLLSASPAHGARLLPEGGGARLAQLSLVSPEEARLRAQAEDLTRRINDLRVDWSIGALVMVGVGFAVGTLMLLPAIIVTALGAMAGFIAVGLVLLGVAVGFLALGVAGVVMGVNSANGTRAEREELIRQRAAVEDQLRQLHPPLGPVPVVEAGGRPLVTVVVFP